LALTFERPPLCRIKQFGDEPLTPLIIELEPEDQSFDLLCSDIASAASRKPSIVSYDTDCGSLSYLTGNKAMTYQKINSDYSVPSQYECGTLFVEREYTVKDKCDQESTAVQTMYVEPEAPVFTSVPDQEPQKTYSTSVESLDPDAQGGNWPLASSNCGFAVEVDSTDAIPVEVEGECGLWTVSRIWTARLSFNDDVDDACEANGNPLPPTAQAIQQFHMKDDERTC